MGGGDEERKGRRDAKGLIWGGGEEEEGKGRSSTVCGETEFIVLNSSLLGFQFIPKFQLLSLKLKRIIRSENWKFQPCHVHLNIVQKTI